jgi:hypothetical protein
MTASVEIELTCFSGSSHPGPSARVEADIRYWIHETSLQLITGVRRLPRLPLTTSPVALMLRPATIRDTTALDQRYGCVQPSRDHRSSTQLAPAPG